MSEISRFFGIVIQMYFNDHDPPHFHARSGRNRARIRIAPVEPINSTLPRRHLELALEWASLHEGELLENWRRLRTQKPPLRIAPLE